MTQEEILALYKEDKKEYELEKNTEFKKWIENNKSLIITSDLIVMQKLVNFLVEWYEVKYQNFFPNSNSKMTQEQLLKNLPAETKKILECNYRSNSGYCIPIYQNNKLIGYKDYIGACVYHNGIKEFFGIDKQTGIINNIYIENIVLKKVTLNQAIDIFYKTHDCRELVKIKLMHSIDIELRKKILQFVALKLLYSENSTFEKSYERALKFITEFNEQILNLNLEPEFLNSKLNVKKLKKQK